MTPAPTRAPLSAVEATQLAAIVAAAEPSRLSILFLLGRRGRLCVKDIARGFKASRPAVSHHLKVLKSCGLLEAERDGQEIYYSVRADAVIGALRALADALDSCCGARGVRRAGARASRRLPPRR